MARIFSFNICFHVLLNMAVPAWKRFLGCELASLRVEATAIPEGERYRRLCEVLGEARRRSGLTRIGFDNEVKNMGVDVVSCRVHGSAAELRKALEAAEDRSARGRHAHIPRAVKTACLIEWKGGRVR